MIDKNLMSHEEQQLRSAAGQVDASPSFKNELEKKLMNAHKPKTGFGFPSVKKIVFTTGWAFGVAALILAFIWAIRTIAPQPQPAAGSTPFPNVEPATPKPVTPENKGKAYDWNSTTLYLNAPLPDTPTEANVYLAQPDAPATIESARALASRFGIEGTVYVVPGEMPNTTNFMVTAGGPRIYVRSDNYFSYYENFGGSFIGSRTLTDEQARIAIAAFLKSHGFNFEYQIEHAQQIYGQYYVVPLLDGLSLRYDHVTPARLEITLDDNAHILSVYGSLLNAKQVGVYGIRSAEEAFQEILNNASVGVEQGMHAGGLLDEQVWFRKYPDNQTVTIYGQANVFKPAEAGQLPLLNINDQTVTGNTAGLEAVQEGVIIEASGQFVTENNIRVFQVDSWKYSSASNAYLSGFLRKEGDQSIFASNDGTKYPLTDAPAAPEPPTEQQLNISGMMVDNKLEWTMIQYFAAGSGGGGGGGGGNGLYKLNLTGTPVPFPTAEPTPQATGGGGSVNAYSVQAGDTLEKIAADNGTSVEALMQTNGLSDTTIFIGQTLVIQTSQVGVGEKIENLRGLVNVTIIKKPDGSQRVQYAFSANSQKLLPFGTYFLLEGDSLQDLQNYNNRPINIWGTLARVDNGQAIIKVESYEIPFPDLQFQILKGLQKLGAVNGQQVALFTAENGTTYAQLLADGSPDSNLLGNEGDQVIMETLAVPDETFGEYPTIHVFSSGMATSSKNGEPAEISITADKPTIMDEPPPPATMTIEKVELVYYIADPRFAVADPAAGPPYIQPMWRFTGHYSNGDEFGFIVQALKDEFLLPEIQEVAQPG